MKKDISTIVAEELPGFRCTLFTNGNGDLVCHYDTDASEEIVQKMVELMKRLKIKCTFERMPF